MLERRFSAAELASHAGLSTATVQFFVKNKLLAATVKRASGRGQGHIFSFGDVLDAMLFNGLRLPNASAKPLRNLAAFSRSTQGKKLIEALVDEVGKKNADGGEPEPRVLSVTEKGVYLDRTAASLMKEHEGAVVFCLDVRRFVEKLCARSAEAQMLNAFREPGPSGRMTRDGRKKSAATKKAGTKRPRHSALLREAAERDVGKKKRARK